MAELPQRIGRYEIVGELATGGMAQILRARAHGPNQFSHPVAIKWMLPGLATDPEYQRRFAFEAAINGQLTHPNLVAASDVGVAQGRPYMVLEYVRGWSLRSLWATAALTRTPIPLDIAVSLIHGAAAGLHAAHDLRHRDGTPMGLVHRDVSPFNVLISEVGHAKVLDFGIATTAESERERRGRVLGTTRYIPPEVLHGQRVDRRGDIYSLGVLLYELTTGRHYVAEGSAAPSALRDDYPPLLEAIVLRALDPDPRRRQRTAESMQLALEMTAARLGFPLSALRVAYFVRSLFDGDSAAGPPAHRQPRADSQEVTWQHDPQRHSA